MVIEHTEYDFQKIYKLMYHIFLVENCDEKYIKITKERGRMCMGNGIEIILQN